MAILDRFKKTQGPWPARYVSDPARLAIAANASDTTDLTNGVSVALYVGVSGDVAVTLADMDDGVSVVFKAHPVGYFLNQVKRVWSTGTTATNLLALY